MLQNEAMDVYGDDLHGLEDDEGVVNSQKATQANEVQSFSDLARSKGRTIVALQWLSAPQVPMVASPASHSRANAECILLWTRTAGRHVPCMSCLVHHECHGW